MDRVLEQQNNLKTKYWWIDYKEAFTSYVDLEDIQRKLWLMIVDIAHVNGQVQVGWEPSRYSGISRLDSYL
jgi:protein involved in temperature-dependent protein secretion